MEPTSSPLHINNGSLINEQPNANVLLQIYQKKIISQISKSKRIIQAHLNLLLLMGISLVLYLIPFLFIDRTPRTMAIGTMIILMFNYNLFFQYLRKKPIIHEERQCLQNLKNRIQEEENHLFVPDLSQFLSRLYTLFYFDRKSNKIPSAFLEPYEENQYISPQNQMIKSLRNELLINGFIGIIQVVSACLALVLMPDRAIMPYNAILLAVLIMIVLTSMRLTLLLQKTMKSWMKGFKDLQSWASIIENMPSTAFSRQDTENRESKGQELQFCPSCGEPDQIMNKYCQNCGKMLTSEFGES